MTRPTKRRKPTSDALLRLRSPDARFEKELRRAIRSSAPGEVVTVHAVDCEMSRCTCVPIALVVGPRA